MINNWDNKEFELAIESSLIANYEDKIIKNKYIHKADRLTPRILDSMRKCGVYIPGKDRYIMRSGFDILNDPLPKRGCLSWINHRKPTEQRYKYNGYAFNIYFEKCEKLGHKGWARTSGGQLYCICIVSMQDKGGVKGEKRYLTVDKQGDIKCCDLTIINENEWGAGVKRTLKDDEPYVIKQAEYQLSSALQYEADKKFCWVISVNDEKGKIQIGCTREEVKSLFYARNLPMTKTGRKRPIIHLVEAHKRRLQNGTDINIDNYLRGVKTVEMGGVIFSISQPRQADNSA